MTDLAQLGIHPTDMQSGGLQRDTCCVPVAAWGEHFGNRAPSLLDNISADVLHQEAAGGK